MGVVVSVALIGVVFAGVLSVSLGFHWLPHLRKVSVPGWTALVCLLLGLCLIGWPERVERHRRRKQQTTRMGLRSEDHQESASGEDTFAGAGTAAFR